MRVTYLGHATLLIELDGLTVLTDPLLRGRIAHLRRLAPPVSAEMLEGVDLVLVSHAHHDHLDVPSLKLVPGSPPVLCPASASRAIRRAGLEPEPMQAGEHGERGGVTIEAVTADHDGRRWPTSSSREALGFVLRGSGSSIYFAGDTGLFEELAEIKGVDVALLPVAGWGPKLGPGHLDPAEAARAAAMIQPRIAVPIHWGSYRRMLMRGEDAVDAPARRFAERVGQVAPDVTVRVLAPGEAFSPG